MPRETIATRTPAGFVTEVSWSRGKFAQIAVVADRPIAELGLRDETGLYADLDVDAITRLQALLRRVKKQLLLPPAAQPRAIARNDAQPKVVSSDLGV